MPKAVHKIRKNVSDVKREVLKQMLTLAASGFGLVAALAWNNLIQEIVAQYIKPMLGGASGIISLLIYAILVTVLAVVVTYNLSKLVKN
ncbi:MAG: hypothetical protein ACD_13C00236G0010 [uncultured bacterium]|nr:MAG: hypothetical protein ACD_13C00236G0010 [uncultured bacterium]